MDILLMVFFVNHTTKVNSANTRTICEVYSKLSMKTPIDVSDPTN